MRSTIDPSAQLRAEPVERRRATSITALAMGAALVACGAPSDDGSQSTDLSELNVSGIGSGVKVVTNRYDNARSGANLSEALLTTSSVNASHFGLLFSRRVDGQVYGQPLYLSNVTMPDRSVHNVVYVATEHNTVYAFDADKASASAPLWKHSLGTSGTTSTGAINCDNLSPEVGVTATPVIDTSSGILYVVAKTFDGKHWGQFLHALDLFTGNDRPGSPTAITASVKGNASDGSNGTVSFDPLKQLGRPGLLLQNGVVYMAFASHCDIRPYHGWVISYAYNGASFTRRGAFNVSPNGSEGGIWQSGIGLSSDGSGVFAAVGNGSTNPNANPPDVSESVIRLSLSDLSLKDHWTPSAYVSLNSGDSDLSSGPILLPHSLLITGSKRGQVYLLDSGNLGKFHADGDQIRQTLTTPGRLAGQNGHLHGGPIYYRTESGVEWVYMWPEEGQLIGYQLNAASRTLVTNASGGPLVQGGFATTAPGHPGGIVTLSANGTVAGSGILWASTPKDSPNGAWHSTDTGMLYAVDATNISRVLWRATPITLDDGSVAKVGKFNSPVVANGHVYVATFSGALNVYGLH